MNSIKLNSIHFKNVYNHQLYHYKNRLIQLKSTVAVLREEKLSSKNEEKVNRIKSDKDLVPTKEERNKSDKNRS